MNEEDMYENLFFTVLLLYYKKNVRIFSDATLLPTFNRGILIFLC